jgi:hypothetical protein
VPQPTTGVPNINGSDALNKLADRYTNDYKNCIKIKVSDPVSTESI